MSEGSEKLSFCLIESLSGKVQAAGWSIGVGAVRNAWHIAHLALSRKYISIS